MAMSQDDWAWFAARVRAAVVDINTEQRMSVQVSGLADIVRKAKTAIDAAGGAATRLNDSATRVVNTIGQVDGMTRQLDAANADLTAAVAAMSNGGPPLDDTTSSDSSSLNAALVVATPPIAPTLSPADGIHVAQVQVEAAHAGDRLPAAPTEPIPPTVAVTASTIAADQRAAVAAAAAALATQGVA